MTCGTLRFRRMQSFKEFIMSLPEEIMPDDAKTAYKQYQAEFWGSEIRADFEMNKNEDWCATALRWPGQLWACRLLTARC